MFVVFEGLDRSGKTSLSVKFAEYLNTKFKEEDGLLKVDPHFGDFIWTKEPLFTTEQADELNTSYVDEYKRERLFFESRLKHQEMIAGKNVICDRYMWSGLAYALKYSPNCFRFVKELYLSDTMFLQPDIYVYVDTPTEVCYRRDSNRLDLDVLKELKKSYEETRVYIKTPVIIFYPVEGEEKNLEKFVGVFGEYASKNGLLAQ